MRSQDGQMTPTGNSPRLRRRMLKAAVVLAVFSALLTIAGLLLRQQVAPPSAAPSPTSVAPA